ncbi:MAG: RNA polymerase sigma factor [Acidimicrobiales bacterium]
MDDVEGAVLAARNGDPAAWRQLVDGHTGLVWSVVRGFRFDDETAKDVFQTVWLRLAEHLDRIREPSKLAGWLGQTARNECVGVVRQRGRTIPSEEPTDLGHTIDLALSSFPEPGERLERDENRAAVAAAFARMPARCQQLLRLLVLDPPPSYEDISQLLEMPIGSIGPTRARCLDGLRSSPEISRITGGLRPS